MLLTLINCSPRGAKGNTAKLMENFVKGFNETSGSECRIEYLVRHMKDINQLRNIFYSSENVIIAFPLYADAMPGSVKFFFDSLIPAENTKPRLGFMSQCGFPETAHLRPVERYCEKFTKRLGLKYLGSIMKGGGEGLDIQPAFLLDKYTGGLYEIGKHFGEHGEFDPGFLRKFAYPENLSPEQMAGLIPYVNKSLWDDWMEKNGVLEKSFNKPYARK